ncbi:MAG: DUF488 domain-containing protein [Nitrospiraceae bacterium]
MIKVKRVYDPPSSRDGRRFLVDGLWPRGIKRSALSLSGWLKEVAPSDALRRWFAHEPSRWDTFRRRYAAELNRRPEIWRPLFEAARRGTVTLVYSARDSKNNNAAALKSYLETRMKKRS